MSKPTVEMLCKEVEAELHYHLNGSTSFRYETARLALKVINRTASTKPFESRETAYETVLEALQDLGCSDERIRDVAKLLSVTFKDLTWKLNMPQDVKNYVEEKQRSRRNRL